MYNIGKGKMGGVIMRKFRCLVCKHEFETEDVPVMKCRNVTRFVELVEGEPLKGKPWSSKPSAYVRALQVSLSKKVGVLEYPYCFMLSQHFGNSS